MTVKLARVPAHIHTIEDMCGVLKQLENIESVAVIVEDAKGVWLLPLAHMTAERINWMLDRAKLRLHEAAD